MKTLRFKCTLLSDIILNVKSASEGNNTTLDFIPGSNFLGIAARRYDSFGGDAMTVFHSGRVRFGDAHLGANGRRGIKIPASMYYPKLSAPDKECYIHHLYTPTGSTGWKPAHLDDTTVQLKQCRQGFYIFDDRQATRIHEDRRFAIKSAYDRDKRRSADELMFGYESLVKGATLYFAVEVDDERLANPIAAALTGTHHIGRSRTAQYGLVRIEPTDYTEAPSRAASGLVNVYADGRLIFLDANGYSTLTPTVEQLGLKSGRIAWEKCQIRTFQYAPWNSKRKAFDADRCGIEKGSVFVVEDASVDQPAPGYIGCYRNEGFGKVIYNPAFLEADSRGRALCRISAESIGTGAAETASGPGNEVLLHLLKQLKETDEMNAQSYRIVNKFVKDYGRRFLSANFASQWGKIRSIATCCRSKAEIDEQLFAEKTGYLMHGVAKEKWDEYGRRDTLKKFFDTLTDHNAVQTLVNLSSEMAKLCRKGESRQ